MPIAIRILLLADTHIGFDLPVRPRVERRRRGHDFLANYERALAPALEGQVDLVVHGGDVFHRPRVPVSVAWQGIEPLLRVADRGVPVFVVPGNHERSRLPHARFARHPGIHVFDRPRTFLAEVRGTRVALAGFPFERGDIRTRFRDVLEKTEWRGARSDVRLLCLHHCVEGATVGPGDFTFTTGADVIRARELPEEFAAVLSGHIHRHQVLTRDLAGQPLATPVLYPGSIERTSLAEKGEVKGFMVVDVAPDGSGRQPHFEFRRLPARPMIVRELRPDASDARALEAKVRALLTGLPADAVLRIRVSGTLTGRARQILSAGHLRRVAPPTMNIDISAGDGSGRRLRSRRQSPAAPALLELPFPPTAL